VPCLTGGLRADGARLPSCGVRDARPTHQEFVSSAVAKWWDGRERDWVHEVWDILTPLSEGKWWAYAALCELMRDFERTARALTETIVLEICVEERKRVLKRQPDGTYRVHHMEIVVIPESAEKEWKLLSDELAAVRALWRCRSYYFVPPMMCINDVMGLRVAFRALPPEGSRVIYGAGAAKMQKKAGEQLHREVSRLGELLNLKLHSAYPTAQTPLVKPAGDKAAQQQLLHEDGLDNRAAEQESKRKGAFASFFGSKVDKFETVFGHAVIICTTASGVRFMEMVTGLLPLETGPDMERVAAEFATRRKVKQAEAAAKAAKLLAKQIEKEEADRDDEDDEGRSLKNLYKRFRESAREFLGLGNQVDYNNLSLHELQYKCRELGIKWTGGRFDLIPRIRAEIERQKLVQAEQTKLDNALERQRHLRKERRRKEAARLEGLGTNRPGFGLKGLRRPLRPEYVRQCAERLNSDAAVAWDSVIETHKADRLSVERATELYFHSTIPQVAVDLQRLWSDYGNAKVGDLAAKEQQPYDILKRVCRASGVRARDFGKLYNASRLTELRCTIVTEMLARLCKSLLRSLMLEALRSCRGLSQQPVYDAVCEFLRLVFGKIRVLWIPSTFVMLARTCADQRHCHVDQGLAENRKAFGMVCR